MIGQPSHIFMVEVHEQFPILYMVEAWVQGPKRRQSMCHFFVKDTWTKEFLVLSSPRDDKTPRVEFLQAFQAEGLGKKKLCLKTKLITSIT